MTVSAKDESRRNVLWDGLRYSLGQKTITIFGFPQALQLLALYSIPNLLAKLKNIDDSSWENEMVDANIEYLENFVLEGHKFYPSQWPEPELPHSKTNDEQVQTGATISRSETGRVGDYVLIGLKEKELKGKVKKLIDDHKTWVINQKNSDFFKTDDIKDCVKEMLKEH
ncbi:unnamed protein product [Cochlearia groenlandica]